MAEEAKKKRVSSHVRGGNAGADFVHRTTSYVGSVREEKRGVEKLFREREAVRKSYHGIAQSGVGRIMPFERGVAKKERGSEWRKEGGS